MKRALAIILALVVATPAFARGHGSTAPMCSTCTHRTLCRFDELFSCDRSKPSAQRVALPEERPPHAQAQPRPAEDKTHGDER